MLSAYSGQQFYLDSNIVIYALEDSSDWPTAARGLLEAIDSGEIRAATSELTLAEVMTKPIALGDPGHIGKYERFFSSASPLVMLDVGRDVLMRAARLRASAGLKLLDAIHVATAQIAACDYFLTQDERLGRALAGQPKWVKLSELA